MTEPLTNRPAAGLYIAAWSLGVVGLVGLFVGVMTGPPWRGVLVVAGVAALLLALVTAAGYQTVARRARPAWRFHGPAPLIVFCVQFALVNIVTLVLIGLGAPLPDNPVGFFLATVVLLAGYVVVVWLFGVRTGALTWRDLGLPAVFSARKFVNDVSVGVAVMFAVAIVAGILGGLLAQLLGTEAPSVVPTPTSAADIALLALGAGLLVPIGEELLFRGYALTAWWRDIGPRAALLRATVFFAVVHIATLTSATFGEGVRQAILVLAIIGPVGLALGWLFMRRGLIAAIAGHAAFNLFGVLVLVLAQYLPPPPGG